MKTLANRIAIITITCTSLRNIETSGFRKYQAFYCNNNCYWISNSHELFDVSTMLAVVSAVREVGLDHINYSIPFTEIWLLNISLKKHKRHFAQAISDIPTIKKWAKTYISTGRCKHFATGREINEDVVDDLFHAEEVGNNISGFFSKRSYGGE